MKEISRLEPAVPQSEVVDCPAIHIYSILWDVQSFNEDPVISLKYQ